MENEHDAPLKIVTWFLLSTSGVIIIGRMLTKLSSTTERFNVDDAFALLALAFNVGAGAAVSIAANHGLGAPMASLGPFDIDEMRKGIYAAGISSILAVACAKLSIVILLHLLFVKRSHRIRLHRNAILALGGVLVAQMLSCTIVALVPCRAPNVWAIGADRCLDLEGFWRAVGIINILIDISLIAVPCYLVDQTQLSRENKNIVISCFAVRIIDIAATATQLAYTHGFSSSDLSAAVWPWYLVGQVAQTAGIISSSTPYLHKPLQALTMDMFRGEEEVDAGSVYANIRQISSATTKRRFILRDIDDDSDSQKSAMRESSAPSIGLRGWNRCRVTTSIRGNEASHSAISLSDPEHGDFAVLTSNTVTIEVSNAGNVEARPSAGRNSRTDSFT